MSDHLTSLPFELFEMIVHLVQTQPRTKPLYVSEAFLPFVRRLMFKETTIESYSKLSTFLELVNSNKAIVLYIITLEIKLEDEKDEGVPKNKALTTGFSQLASTRYLTLEGSSRIAKLLLAPLNARSLPSMSYLRIQDPLNGFQNPLDPSNFRWLERYSDLGSFCLAITRDINEVGRSRRKSSANAETPSNINWQIGFLVLEGRFVRNPSLLDFISSFPSVYRYSFFEKTVDGSASLIPLLDHLPTFLQVDYLAITTMSANLEDFSPVFRKFANLETLDIGLGTSRQVLDTINHTNFPKLTTLVLRRGVQFSIEQIKSLISGAEKLSKLKEIELRIVVRDPAILEDKDYQYSWERDEVDGPYGLIDGITAKGLEEIVHLADKEGLTLTGYAAEFARREIGSRKEDSKGRSRWERRYELYAEDDWY